MITAPRKVLRQVPVSLLLKYISCHHFTIYILSIFFNYLRVSYRNSAPLTLNS